jgi:hypothetical protein
LQALREELRLLDKLGATPAFGWLAYAALPGWFAGNQGLLLTTTTLSCGVTVTIMVFCMAAYFGLVRGYAKGKPV